MTTSHAVVTSMPRWRPHPGQLLIPALLVVNGAALAGTLALSKAAQTAGVSPITYGFWMTFGGGLILGLIAAVRREFLMSAERVRYSVISGLISMAAPQLILLLVVGHIGAGLTSAVYAFPTLATWIIARFLGMERHSTLRLTGVSIGAAGALTLLAPGAVPAGNTLWLVLALTVPIMLGAGNIYRSVAWPQGAPPVALASGMALSTSVFFLAISLLVGSDLSFWHSFDTVALTTAQIALSALQFLAFFLLQRVAKPVTFSLIGQIALVFGLVIGSALLGETFSLLSLIAVALIVIGWALVAFGETMATADADSGE